MAEKKAKIGVALSFWFFAIFFALALSEGVLRIKNSSMKNYDIEMWRYANELKIPSPDPKLGHEHKSNVTAVLQSIPIRLNEVGLRGGSLPSQKPGRTILFLGSSITFGWGVLEEQTVSARLERGLRDQGEDVSVLNAGIGNYNAYRYVNRFFDRLAFLKPSDIVVQYFLRDAEELDAGRGNWFLRNSQLAVTLWNVAQRLVVLNSGTNLEKHYQKVYDPQSRGFQTMKNSLRQLSEYSRQNNIRLYLAMTPDVHNLKAYPFRNIHDQMKQVAGELRYRYVDLLPSLEGLSAEEVWSMPGDPHPNGMAHGKMAAALLPVLHGDHPVSSPVRVTP